MAHEQQSNKNERLQQISQSPAADMLWCDLVSMRFLAKKMNVGD